MNNAIDLKNSVPADATSGFGRAASFTNDTGFNLALSADRQAFTAGFSNLVVNVDGRGAPIVKRDFSFALPLKGVDPAKEFSLFVSGIYTGEAGAFGHLVVSVNDVTTVRDFRTDEGGFVHTTGCKFGDASEMRVSLFIWIDRDSESIVSANLTIDTIDIDLAMPAG